MTTSTSTAPRFADMNEARGAGYRSAIGAPESTERTRVYLTNVANPRDPYDIGKWVEMIAPHSNGDMDIEPVPEDDGSVAIYVSVGDEQHPETVVGKWLPRGYLIATLLDADGKFLAHGSWTPSTVEGAEQILASGLRQHVAGEPIGHGWKGTTPVVHVPIPLDDLMYRDL